MSDTSSPPHKLPAWALLAGVTALAVGTRALIAVAEQSGSFGRTKELTPTAMAAAALAAAVGTYGGRRWINRPSGFLLGVALAGVAMLLLAGTSNIGAGLGVGAVVSLATPFVRHGRQALLALGMGAVVGGLVWLLAPWESGWVWGSLVAMLAFLVAGLRLPPKGERGAFRWASLAARCLALALVLALMVGWGSFAANRRIVAELRAGEGYLDFERLPHVPRRWIRQAENLGLAPIENAMVGGPQVDDALLDRLVRLPKLNHLSISQAPLTAAGLQRLAEAPVLISLNLADCQVAPEGWKSLGNAPRLCDLRLENVPLGDAGLAELAKLPQLQSLWVVNCSVTHQGLAALRGHRTLEDLGIIGPEATSAVLLELPHLPALQSFAFGRRAQQAARAAPTPAASPLREAAELPEVAAVRNARTLKRLRLFAPDDDLLHALSRAAPSVMLRADRTGALQADPEAPERVVHADLSFTGAHDDLALTLGGHKSLRSLDLSGCDLTRENLEQLLQLPDLETLVLDRAGIVEDGLATLAKSPRLERLSLRKARSPYGPFAHLLDLAKYQPTCALRELDLSYTEVVDGDLRFIAPLTQLRALSLAGNPLTDTGLAHLTGMTALERLDLRETQVTAAGVQALEAKLPTVQIRWNAP